MTDTPTIKFNLNDRVRFRVCPEGVECWDRYWALGDPSKIPQIETDDDGYTALQLWEFMAIFGPAMVSGFNPAVETTIYLEGTKR